MLIYCSLCLGWGEKPTVDVCSMLPPRWLLLHVPPSPSELLHGHCRGFASRKNIWWKTRQKIEDNSTVKLGPKWGARWVDKLSIMWIMPSMLGGDYRFRWHVSKIDDKSWNADLEKLDFHVPSRAKTQLPLFHIYWKCYQLGTQMGFRLVRVDALRRES
jgi:hypothetical protein